MVGIQGREFSAAAAAADADDSLLDASGSATASGQKSLGAAEKLRFRKLEGLVEAQAAEVIHDALSASSRPIAAPNESPSLAEAGPYASFSAAAAAVVVRNGVQLLPFYDILEYTSPPANPDISVPAKFQLVAKDGGNPLPYGRNAEIIAAAKDLKLRPVFQPEEFLNVAAAITARAASLWGEVRHATANSSSNDLLGDQSVQHASPTDGVSLSATADHPQEPALDQLPANPSPPALNRTAGFEGESSQLAAQSAEESAELSGPIDHSQQPALEQLPDDIPLATASEPSASLEPDLEEPFGAWSSSRPDLPAQQTSDSQTTQPSSVAGHVTQAQVRPLLYI